MYDSAPDGRWHTTTMRLDGSTSCMAVEGATDTDVFIAYVERCLFPILRKGDIVVMDNLAPHKLPAIVHAIQQPEPTCGTCRSSTQSPKP